MTEAVTESLLTDDYTTLQRSVSRQWTVNDASLAWAGGVVLSALLPAATVAAVTAAAVLPVLLLLGAHPGWVAAVAAAGFVVAYLQVARESTRPLSVVDRLRVGWNWRRRQPRALHGLGAATEPDELRWALILWRPAAPRRREAGR